jgi:pimeloyl-ACP methyl ester carboxylesterase
MLAPDLRPPLVLLHGALGAAAQLAPLASLLVDHFRVFVLDFSGHGARPGAAMAWRLETFVADLADVLTAASIGPARVFGYSMGGYVALTLAARQPELIHSVLTLGTKFVWDEATATRETARLDPAIIRAKVPAFADSLAALHAAGSGWETLVSGTAEVLRDLGRNPLLSPEVLATIPQPVRVLVGDRDATVTVEETATAYRALPNGQLGVLPGTPHPLDRVKPVLLAAQIRAFFGDADGA